MKPKKQTVYLPVKVQDELPENNKNVFCLTSDGFETELVFEDGEFRLYEGGDCYENENVSHWLKEQGGYFFTPEQLNQLLSNVIKNTINTAAESVDSEDCFMYSSERNRYDSVIESITSTFEETFNKFKV